MIATTVLLLLLLAAVQADGEVGNGTDCETAKESVERSFQILSISTRQLGQKCREEKRECDKKMRETAKLEGEKTKCEEKLADLDDQIANYAASFDELGTELQKCKEETENGGSGAGVCENLEELEQLRIDKESVQSDLNREKEEKEKLEAELGAAKTESENLRGRLEEEGAEREKLNSQLEEEKESRKNQEARLEELKKRDEELERKLEEERTAKEKLEEALNAQTANQSKLQTEFDRLKKELARLEKETAEMESKLKKCNELRIETPEISNEVENKNISEKCSRIGRDLDLIRTQVGIYYFNYNTALPWLSANDYCKSRGLQLATAETAEEVLEVGRVRSRGYHVAFWTSASDKGHSPGQFHWANGRKVAADLWFPGQPDQATFGRADCAYVFGSRLKDSPCSDSFYFACQVPQECVPHLR